MQNSTKRVSVWVLALAVAACKQAAPPIDLKAEEQKIIQLNEQWAAAIAAKNIDGTIAPYAPAAVYLLPNAEPAKGDAIRQAWSEVLQLPEMSLSFAPTHIGFDAAGTVAYDVGTYSFSFQSPAGKVEDHGKYVDIWRKIDGEWKVVVDIFNTSVPLPASPAQR